MKDIFGGSLVVLSLALSAAPLVSAQVIVQPSSSCLSLQTYMRYGANDYSTGGAVSALQSFLSAQGYFNSAYLGTGRFGSLTFASVQRFQSSQGLPATGYVGPLTVAAISNISCGTSNTPVSLYSISPSAGAIGTTISITGFGFTSDNTVLMDGLIAKRNVPITSSIAIACTTNPACHGGINQTIQFPIPSTLAPNCPVGSMCPLYLRQVTPAQYKVTVQNANGTSNTLVLTVTGDGTSQPLSINGLSTPSTLTIGQQGIWTVNVLAGSGSGNLHYSVVWGDEAQNNGSYIMAPQATPVQSSGSFTHTYQRSGTYTPTFTVTDDAGHSVTASNTIVVQPVY